MSEPNIVFVLYESNKHTGLMLVKGVVDTFDLAKEFKLLSQTDKISRYVEAFIPNTIGRNFVSRLPEETIMQLQQLEEL